MGSDDVQRGSAACVRRSQAGLPLLAADVDGLLVNSNKVSVIPTGIRPTVLFCGCSCMEKWLCTLIQSIYCCVFSQESVHRGWLLPCPNAALGSDSEMALQGQDLVPNPKFACYHFSQICVSNTLKAIDKQLEPQTTFSQKTNALQ